MPTERTQSQRQKLQDSSRVKHLRYTKLQKQEAELWLPRAKGMGQIGSYLMDTEL